MEFFVTCFQFIPEQDLTMRTENARLCHICLMVSILSCMSPIISNAYRAAEDNASVPLRTSPVPHGDKPGTVDSVLYALNGSMSDFTFTTMIEKARELSPVYPYGTAAGAVIDVYLYQAWSFFNEPDSIAKYAVRAADGIQKVERPFITVMYYNARGMNAMVNELNYAVALYWFEKSIQTAFDTGNEYYAVTPLANICHIYYLRKDPTGIKYARQAYDIMSHDIDKTGDAYYKILSRITMSQMSLLSSGYKTAEECLNEAKSIAAEFDINAYNMLIAVVDADLCIKQGYLQKAVENFENGLRYEKYAESSVKAMLYLKYGETLESLGQHSVALSMYDKGLDVLSQSRSLEFKSDLLAAKADLLLGMKDFKGSAETALEYYSLMEKTVSIKEREFESEINARIVAENENRILQQELAMKRMEKTVILIILVFAVLLAVTVILYLSHRHQLRLYKLSVRKTDIPQDRQETVPAAGIDADRDSAPEDASDKHRTAEASIRNTYTGIEQLMRSGYYRTKDLNMDMLAEKLGTNRTYVSKAINRFSGLTFWQFIDSYRISEALKRIEAQGTGTVFKSLAEELGYSSLSVFSRAFRKATGTSPADYAEKVCKS